MQSAPVSVLAMGVHETTPLSLMRELVQLVYYGVVSAQHPIVSELPRDHSILKTTHPMKIGWVSSEMLNRNL